MTDKVFFDQCGKFIKQMAEISKNNELTEIEVKYTDKDKFTLEIQIERDNKTDTQYTHASLDHNYMSQHLPYMHTTTPKVSDLNHHQPANTEESTTANNDASKNQSKDTPVNSPMVGVVFFQPSPDEPAFVKIGDTVKKGDTLCLIEAMKVFNPIKASISGTVKNILLESGDAVEYGETMLTIEE